MAAEQASYIKTVDEIMKWYRQQRDDDIKLKDLSRSDAKVIGEIARQTALETVPAIYSDINIVADDGTFVFRDDPLASFENSPYTRLKNNHRILRQGTLVELLDRADNFRGLPDILKSKITTALRQVQALPKFVPPQLDQETIVNLSRLSDHLTTFDWQKFMLGFKNVNALLIRTLAARFDSGTPSVGFTYTTLKLTDHALWKLDVIAGCTAPRLNVDPAGYAAEVRAVSLAHTREERYPIYLREGVGMWADERLDDVHYGGWVDALRTGQRPKVS